MVQFWDQHIQADLMNAKPPLMAATIKFLSLFRLIIGRERLAAAIKPLSQLLTNESPVVAGYAAHAIERILMTKMPSTKEPLVNKQIIQPFQESVDNFKGYIDIFERFFYLRIMLR